MLNTQQNFGNVKNTIKPTDHNPLTRSEIGEKVTRINPETGKTEIISDTTQIIDTQEELEASIINRNKKHFAQAKGTPFTEAPLKDIGKHEFNLNCDENNNPIELPDGYYQETHEVINLLKEKHKTSKKWSHETCLNEFKRGILKWRESTTTSPSGRHLGIYRAVAIASDDKAKEFQDQDKNKITTQQKATEILDLMYMLGFLAISLGCFLKRWTDVLNIMIYKKAGDINLDRLRVIHLFEADFNLLVGIIFAQHALQYLTQNDKIHKNQY